MQRLTFDIDLRKFVVSPGSQTPLAQTTAKRDDPNTFEIQYTKGGSAVELDNTATFILGVKDKVSLSTGYLVSETNFVKSGTGAQALYTVTPEFDTMEIGAYFTSKSDPASAILGLEVIYTIGGVPTRSQIVSLLTENSLNRGNESTVSANTQITTLTDGATVTWSANRGINNATVTLGGNRTLAMNGLIAGAFGTLVVKQDGTGSRTLALPAGSKVGAGGGGVITLTSASGSVDILRFFYDGSSILWTPTLHFT